MNRVLITGASGLLGQYLVKQLIFEKPDNKTPDILAIDLAANPFENSGRLSYHQLDLTGFSSVRAIIYDFKPDYIFNCAAYNNVDDCEVNYKLADDLNTGIVENLLSCSFNKLIHFSSDYIFSGQNGPYSELAIPDPINYYGYTKLQSEKILQASKKNYLVIRTNVLYGDGINLRHNFITWLIDSLRTDKEINVVTDQFNNPTHAGNLAGAAIEAAKMDYFKVLNIAGADYLSRYDIAIKTAEHFKLDANLIKPIKTAMLGQIAERPHKGGFNIDKAKKILKTRLIGLPEGLEMMRDYFERRGFR
ncbi:MAG: SDR family oxidoreductase [candidate division Zixibacteria bacterium]|nr:SDR family oxidoreductase [candidate division Zixibacteria bacterium]